ncbi:hypothetical protein H708_00989 [Bartonella bacilliformis VAB9028]|nr:hypothetical protein H708_00989 [Bartonella bacilliformis VAB9028]
MRIIYSILLTLLLSFPVHARGSMLVSNPTSDTLSIISIALSVIQIILFVIFI